MENRFHVTERISTLVHIYTSKHRFAVSFHQIKHKAYWKLETSNSGLQYYCRWVGKGKTTQNNDTYSITSPWLKEKNDRFKTSKWTSYIKKTMHFNMTRKSQITGDVLIRFVRSHIITMLCPPCAKANTSLPDVFPGLSLVIFLREHSGHSPHNFKEPGNKTESPVKQVTRS